VPLSVGELEQRLAELQSQLERLSNEAEHKPVAIEERLTAMSARYDEYLTRWGSTVERHTRAVAELEGHIRSWKDAGTRITEDTAERFQKLETIIEHEWVALRNIHEQPVHELRQQAAALTEMCVATASAAQAGFDRAETRLVAFEAEFHRSMGELTREVQTAIAAVASRPDTQMARLEGSNGPWSFEDVTRLHSQLRERATVADAPGPQPLPAIALTAGSVAPAPPRTRADERRARWGRVAAALIVLAAFGAMLEWRLQGQLRADAERVRQTELQSQNAIADAARQAAAVREEAAREISKTHEIADRAERVSEVMASADLVRYSLAGASAAPAASGRAMWSRSRGLVLSATRLPPPPPRGSHQVWLLTRGAPVKAGAVNPEGDGTVTFVEEPPNVARAVVGILVTAERAPAGDVPAGPPVLTSVIPIQ
jgi:hypothetical protein